MSCGIIWGMSHTCLPSDKLVAAAADMLGVDPELTKEILEQLLAGQPRL